jgi:hypothetical protein
MWRLGNCGSGSTVGAGADIAMARGGQLTAPGF